jgi:hypothetical protein
VHRKVVRQAWFQAAIWHAPSGTLSRKKRWSCDQQSFCPFDVRSDALGFPAIMSRRAANRICFFARVQLSVAPCKIPRSAYPASGSSALQIDAPDVRIQVRGKGERPFVIDDATAARCDAETESFFHATNYLSP